MSRTYPINPETHVPDADGIEADVWSALRRVEDPELPISVVDLGLVYDVSVVDGHVEIDLTLTYSGCPARDLIVTDVRNAVLDASGVEDVSVSVVHSPPWSYQRITEKGRQALNEHGLAVPDETADLDADCR